MTRCAHIVTLCVGHGEPKTAHGASERCIHLDHVVGVGIFQAGCSQQSNRPATGKKNGNAHGSCDDELKNLTHRRLYELENGCVGHPATLAHGL